ncbi:MAG: quinolinate synthase NadA [Elusimicrobia bacterium]|nr:quinolinate synthase NadA [Elusimicrobiota bacterium]
MMSEKTLLPTKKEIDDEAARLEAKGLLQLGGHTEETLLLTAEKTWRINRLKAQNNAVIPAHVYQRAEILLGIADFTGDSYRLAKLCTEVKAERIVFCGVRFMAETAKILNPEKTVILPALEAGCSLAESITGEDVRKLKARHPGVPAVCYINTTADVKAECDAVVTSANARTILEKLYRQHPKLIFLPDELMGKNLARDLNKKLGEEMIIWKGTCIVHEDFDASWVQRYRQEYPGVKILAHTECSPSLVEIVDFAGGTGDMMKYVKNTDASYYMLVTECGLGDLARTEFPGKKFVPMCRLCPYMKSVDLDHVEQALRNPGPDHIIEVSEGIRVKAKKAIDAMFALA